MGGWGRSLRIEQVVLQREPPPPPPPQRRALGPGCPGARSGRRLFLLLLPAAPRLGGAESPRRWREGRGRRGGDRGPGSTRLAASRAIPGLSPAPRRSGRSGSRCAPGTCLASQATLGGDSARPGAGALGLRRGGRTPGEGPRAAGRCSGPHLWAPGLAGGPAGAPRHYHAARSRLRLQLLSLANP